MSLVLFLRPTVLESYVVLIGKSLCYIPLLFRCNRISSWDKSLLHLVTTSCWGWMMFRPVPIIPFFSPYYSIQTFSNNAPNIPKDLPHYSQIFSNVPIEILGIIHRLYCNIIKVWYSFQVKMIVSGWMSSGVMRTPVQVQWLQNSVVPEGLA